MERMAQLSCRHHIQQWQDVYNLSQCQLNALALQQAHLGLQPAAMPIEEAIRHDEVEGEMALPQATEQALMDKHEAPQIAEPVAIVMNAPVESAVQRSESIKSCHDDSNMSQLDQVQNDETSEAPSVLSDEHLLAKISHLYENESASESHDDLSELAKADSSLAR